MPGAPSPAVARSRASVANLSQRYGADDPRTQAAKSLLKASKADEYVRRLVESAPPLTDEQRTKLARILAPHLAAGGN